MRYKSTSFCSSLSPSTISSSSSFSSSSPIQFILSIQFHRPNSNNIHISNPFYMGRKEVWEPLTTDLNPIHTTIGRPVRTYCCEVYLQPEVTAYLSASIKKSTAILRPFLYPFYIIVLDEGANLNRPYTKEETGIATRYKRMMMSTFT